MSVAYVSVERNQLQICTDCLKPDEMGRWEVDEETSFTPKNCHRCGRFLENELNEQGARFVLRCWAKTLRWSGMTPGAGPVDLRLEEWLEHYTLSDLRQRAGENALTWAQRALEDAQLKMFLHEEADRRSTYGRWNSGWDKRHRSHEHIVELRDGRSTHA